MQSTRVSLNKDEQKILKIGETSDNIAGEVVVEVGKDNEIKSLFTIQESSLKVDAL